ncbi:hypothetical protein [Sphingobium sp.]|uniref:hypothetical protein n=1 Tax=Sphingobium sp. TaxID=1912891 RepID=UPI003B3A5438
MMMLGRRVAGIIGMRAAVGLVAVIAAIPIMLFLMVTMSCLTTPGPLVGDQLKDILLLGTIALSAATGVGGAVFFRWHDQPAKYPATA